MKAIVLRALVAVEDEHLNDNKFLKLLYLKFICVGQPADG